MLIFIIKPNDPYIHTHTHTHEILYVNCVGSISYNQRTNLVGSFVSSDVVFPFFFFLFGSKESLVFPDIIHCQKKRGRRKRTHKMPK